MFATGPALFWGGLHQTGRLFGSHFDGTNGGQDAIDVYGHTLNWGIGSALSSTQKKFGATSLNAPASSPLARLTCSSSDFKVIGTGDFCWQGWCWVDNSTTVPSGFQPFVSLTGTGQDYTWQLGTSDHFAFQVDGVQVLNTPGLALGSSFQFLEVTRISGVTGVYAGGNVIGTFSDSTNRTFDTITFGGGTIPGAMYWDDWELSLGGGYIPPGGYLIGNTPPYNAAGPTVQFIYPP